MKLHQLVKLKNLLQERIVVTDACVAAEELVTNIQSIAIAVDGLSDEHATLINAMAAQYNELLNLLESPCYALTTLHNSINEQINSITATWNKRGYIINGTKAVEVCNEDAERNLRQIILTDTTTDLVKSRIDLYCDWRYPGMEIGPGDGVWTNLLVANDPLYLIDINPEFLDIAARQFPPEYQNRLRPYLIDRNTNELDALPQGQFGFIFAWGVFNFFPELELTSYLQNLYSLLRPGGVLMFSYNNCNNYTQAEFAETGWMSWMPKTKLTKLVTNIGFEIIEFFDPQESISWIEIKKPGKKKSIKAHQVMGEIKTVNS